MAGRLAEKDLEAIWSSITNDQQIPASLSEDFKATAQICQMLTDYYRRGTSHSIDQSSLPDQDKKELLTFLGGKNPASGELKVDWKVSIVVGNQYVQKSLHPVAQLTVQGEPFELDLDAVAQIRLALAKALMTTDKYVA